MGNKVTENQFYEEEVVLLFLLRAKTIINLHQGDRGMLKTKQGKRVYNLGDIDNPPVWNYSAREYLSVCIYNEIIENLVVEKVVKNKTAKQNNEYIVDQTTEYNPEKLEELRNSNYFPLDLEDENSLKVRKDKGISYSYYLDLNYSKLDEYVKAYLMGWMENKLIYPEECNVLRAEEQLKKTIEIINPLIEKCVLNNLRIDYQLSTELSIISAIFFLREIGAIEILDHYFNQGPSNSGFFRLSVTDRFYQFFNKFNELSFDWDELKDNFRNEEHGAVPIIYNGSYLIQGDIKLQVYSGPRKELLELARKSREVDVNSLKDFLDINGKLDRSGLETFLNNFRTYIRNNFKFSERRKPFEQSCGKIHVKGFSYV